MAAIAPPTIAGIIGTTGGATNTAPLSPAASSATSSSGSRSSSNALIGGLDGKGDRGILTASPRGGDEDSLALARCAKHIIAQVSHNNSELNKKMQKGTGTTGGEEEEKEKTEDRGRDGLVFPTPTTTTITATTIIEETSSVTSQMSDDLLFDPPLSATEDEEYKDEEQGESDGSQQQQQKLREKLDIANQTVQSCLASLRSVRQNSAVKQRQLEQEILYLRKRIADMEAAAMAKEALATGGAGGENEGNNLAQNSALAKKVLTTLQNANAQNYRMKRLLLTTCDRCRAKIAVHARAGTTPDDTSSKARVANKPVAGRKNPVPVSPQSLAKNRREMDNRLPGPPPRSILKTGSTRSLTSSSSSTTTAMKGNSSHVQVAPVSPLPARSQTTRSMNSSRSITDILDSKDGATRGLVDLDDDDDNDGSDNYDSFELSIQTEETVSLLDGVSSLDPPTTTRAVSEPVGGSSVSEKTSQKKFPIEGKYGVISATRERENREAIVSFALPSRIGGDEADAGKQGVPPAERRGSASSISVASVPADATSAAPTRPQMHQRSKSTMNASALSGSSLHSRTKSSSSLPRGGTKDMDRSSSSRGMGWSKRMFRSKREVDDHSEGYEI